MSILQTENPSFLGFSTIIKLNRNAGYLHFRVMLPGNGVNFFGSFGLHQLHPQFLGPVKSRNISFKMLLHYVKILDTRKHFFKKKSMLKHYGQPLFYTPPNLPCSRGGTKQPRVAENCPAEHDAVTASLFTLLFGFRNRHYIP